MIEKSFKELYMACSKHSNYQILPSNLKNLIDDEDLVVKSRFEQERFNYIIENVDFKGKTVLDIGGNIGFFTFESSNEGARRVEYYEGNGNHANFVTKAVEVLNLGDKIEVIPEYYLFEGESRKYDIAYLMNVVHHFGDDFGECSSIEKAKTHMISCINYMAKVTNILIFQMGFNWCGDRKKCLFEHGSKTEMEEFVMAGTEKYWRVIKTGIAVKNDSGIKYEDMKAANNQRNDELGEFLNRPLFIMESKSHV